MGLDVSLQRMWYRRQLGGVALMLLPLSWLFRGVVWLRRTAYRSGWFKSVRVDRPVIVVGNITVGGTGKTPLTIWLADALQRRGRRVGIVLRGYGGRAVDAPVPVTGGTDWQEVGDEAVLLARATGAIVVAGRDRIAGARRAIELGANVVLSDDGLQHYRLARECEIAVVDAQRLLGNGRLLPAGPLREPSMRLDKVSCVVLMSKNGKGESGVQPPIPGRVFVHAQTRLGSASSLAGNEVRDLASFRSRNVHAIAGVGNPQAFFDALVAAGLKVVPHPLADHAVLTRSDITFPDDAPVLMTQKDAVKCAGIADHRHWAVAMNVELTAMDAATVMAIVERAAIQKSSD